MKEGLCPMTKGKFNEKREKKESNLLTSHGGGRAKANSWQLQGLTKH
jgi:hypothetical protein